MPRNIEMKYAFVAAVGALSLVLSALSTTEVHSARADGTPLAKAAASGFASTRQASAEK